MFISFSNLDQVIDSDASARFDWAINNTDDANSGGIESVV
jgi:hypothetical protein